MTFASSVWGNGDVGDQACCAPGVRLAGDGAAGGSAAQRESAAATPRETHRSRRGQVLIRRDVREPAFVPAAQNTS